MYLSVLDQYGRKIPSATLTASAGDYDGAATGRRMGTWGLSTVGPNTALIGSLSSLRSRTRKLTINNPLASGAIDSFVANMIGQGITPRWQLDDKVLKEEIQLLWSDWVDEADADGTNSFYGLQALIARSMMDAGEVLNRFIHRDPEMDLAVPLQLQTIEADHLDPAYNTLTEQGNEVRMGIELAKGGGRAAYWIFRDHPGETFMTGNYVERIPVPASEMQHIFRPLRPGQLRGRPWLTPVIVELKEIDECVDAELVRRKTTAMFGGFIKKIDGSGGTPFPVPGRDSGQDDNNVQIYALEPGTFPKLPPGYDVVFSQPHDVSGNYVVWMKQQLRDIARGIGVTYEQLTGDLEGVTFSSIRAGLLEFRRLCRMIMAQTIVFQYCRPIVNRWMDTVVLSGRLRIRDYFDNPRKYKRVKWMPDGWDWVKPIEDVKAAVIERRAGFNSRARIIAERTGEDAEVIDRENAEENSRADNSGLVYDSDARVTSGAGVYQEGRSDDQE